MEKLKDRLDYLNGLIDKYQKQLEKKEQKPHGYYPWEAEDESIIQLRKKIHQLFGEVSKIEKTLVIADKEPIICSERIDLYKTDQNPKGYYIVCLSGTKTIIGEVGCNNENNNIHYVIDQEYQNNGYGFQAVVTMLNYLVLSGIENIEILIKKENAISIKMAEKLKNIFPNFSENIMDDYLMYHFCLRKKKNKEDNISYK